MKNLVFKSEEHIVNISFLGKTSELSALIPNNKKYCVVLHESFPAVPLSRRGGGLSLRRPPLHRPPHRGC